MFFYANHRFGIQLRASLKSGRRKLIRLQQSILRRMVHQTCGEHIQPSLINENRKNYNYQEAIYVLNRLQSNVDVIERAKRHPESSALRNVPDTIKYLARLGIALPDLDNLKAIHVSGTKGKGSTCAFCESILRQFGLKTGFFSSPHIIAVRERIRINGQPLSEKVFASYFWEVYEILCRQSKSADDMPPYFKFLTVMAYYVFLKEKIDVAVIEVGIGGQYDCTNVLRNPVVCGISSLGLDHTVILGKTLKSIAWQKAGIMKLGALTFTSEQNNEAMSVLEERAENLGVKLVVARPLTSHCWKDRKIVLGLSGEVQETNAALALHLATHWLQKNKFLPETSFKQYENGLQGPVIEITDKMAEGLRNCQWAGRYQVFRRSNIVYYLDGAHTVESIQTCVKWFNGNCDSERKAKRVVKGLLFSITGDRMPESLLVPLLNGQFDFVLFSPTILFDSNEVSVPVDLINVTVSKELHSSRCEEAEKVWVELLSRRPLNGKHFKTSLNEKPCWTRTFPSINDSLSFLKTKQFLDEFSHLLVTPQITQENDLEVHLLVTGSLHLVGGVLGLLDLNINRDHF